MRTPILIVENNPSHLKLELLALGEEAYDMYTATNAEETLRALTTFQPQLILMGLDLPDMDGLELARQLKADPRHQHIPIIAVTAHAMAEDKKTALAAGFDGYLSKPIDVEKFSELINKYIRK